jgi:hypothetical protein
VSVVTSTTRNGKAASGRSQRERDIVTLRILRSWIPKEAPPELRTEADRLIGRLVRKGRRP